MKLARRPVELLDRILDDPELVAAVRDADPGVLHELIDHLGLDDAGEVVSLMTTGQIEQVLDEDVWRNDRPGEDETFDAERFALWLEIMLEAGEGFAARRLVDLDEDLVTLALDRLILVIDRDALILSMSSARRPAEADLLDKALESCLYLDLEEFQLISRGGRGWDAVIAVLLETDRNNHELLRRLLERLTHLSSEYIEDNGGLYDVLTSEEMLEGDLAAAREDRRAERGFVAPAAARGFLGLVDKTPLDEILAARETDPITHAYFRDLAGAEARAASAVGAPAARREAEGVKRGGGLLAALREAGVVTGQPPTPLLGRNDEHATAALLSAALHRIRDDGAIFARRLAEIAYLANVLVSGSSLEGRRYRPVEAAEAAISICDRGLAHLIEARGGPVPDVVDRATALLERESLVKLFKIGWKLGQRGVSVG